MRLKVGETFQMTDEAIENYGEEYRGQTFTVEKVSTSTKEHPGYDEAMEGMPLYDAKELSFSLYQYEVI